MLATIVKTKEATTYATRAKIHLVYSWLLVHGLNLNDRHKAQFLNELGNLNVKFKRMKDEREVLGFTVSELRQFDETSEVEHLENNLVRSLPGKFGIKVIEYAINEAFHYDLSRVPGCDFRKKSFPFKFPSMAIRPRQALFR